MALSLKTLAGMTVLSAALLTLVVSLTGAGAWLGVVFSDALARAIVEVLPI
jgi:hypothetical protein